MSSLGPVVPLVKGGRRGKKATFVVTSEGKIQRKDNDIYIVIKLTTIRILAPQHPSKLLVLTEPQFLNQ